MHIQKGTSVRTKLLITCHALACAAIAIFISACQPPPGGNANVADPLNFSPPTGKYSNGETILIDYPTGATVYITTDGSDPTPEDCEKMPYDGSALSLSNDAITTIKAIFVQNGQPSSVYSASYVIGNASAGPFDVNRELLHKWRNWSLEMQNRFSEPGGVGHVGTHNCEGPQGGNFVWDVTGFFLINPCTGGDSRFTYNACDQTDSQGTHVVAQGRVEGSYCQSGSGSSKGAVELLAGGAWTGKIVDANKNDNNRLPVKGAKYEVTCNEAGCASGAVTYLWDENAGDWEEIPPGNGGVGCIKPGVQIIHNTKGSCAQVTESGDDWNLSLAACDQDNSRQIFNIFESVEGDFQIISQADDLGFSNGGCIHRDGGSDNFIVKNCKATGDNADHKQRFTFIQATDEQLYKIHNSSTNSDACLFSGIINGDNIWGTAGNCGTLKGPLEFKFIDSEGQLVAPQVFAEPE